MEDTAMQHSFTFIILDKIILQNKKNARWRSRKMWQVKEMEEVYGYETSSDFGSNENNNKQCGKTRYVETVVLLSRKE